MTLVIRQIDGKYNVEVAVVYAIDEIPRDAKEILSRKM